MLNKFVQTSLFDIYTQVQSQAENNKSEFIKTLEKHLDFTQIIPNSFYTAFYKRMGRPHKYELESIIRAFVLQMLLGFTDSQLIIMLNISNELKDFCGFTEVLDASILTKFKQQYVTHVETMFKNLVKITEPICREIDEKKADYLIYDTTGIEPCVAENNPKFLNTKLNSAKQFSKSNPNYDPYKGVYSLLPDVSNTNPLLKHQYINGHFCYAFKAGILTNGLGVIRDITLFDEKFKKKHPEIVSQKTDNPDVDKEIGDSNSLKPVLSDFFSEHKDFNYGTFLGDSAFDSYDNFSMLKDDFKFSRACIPLNVRNSKSAFDNFDEFGTPLCPLDDTPFSYLGKSGGKNRSLRFKYVCHKSIAIGSTRVCTCETPCTNSSYGKCAYTYPNKNFRMYPGIPRNTEHFDNLYRHRVVCERTINLIKGSFNLAKPKSYSINTIKFNLLFASITSLLTVILAKAINEPKYFKSTKSLVNLIA